MVGSTRRRKIQATKVVKVNVNVDQAEEAVDMANQNSSHAKSDHKRCKLTGKLTKAQKYEPNGAHTS